MVVSVGGDGGGVYPGVGVSGKPVKVAVGMTVPKNSPSARESDRPPMIIPIETNAISRPERSCRTERMDQFPFWGEAGYTGNKALKVEPLPISVSTHIRPF